MRKICTYILGLTMFLTGCSYDKGNYEYRELDEPQVSGIEDVSVLAYSNLKIEPVFGEGLDLNKYEFE
jgi:PBP1b-binding outer membrane lipoprotein LpoB